MERTCHPLYKENKLLWFIQPQQKEHATLFQAKGTEDEEM
jgi:hypothetical protein